MMTDANAEADRRKKRVEKYFRKTPDPKQRTQAVTFLSASGLGVFLAIIMFASGVGFLGFLLLIAGGYGGYKGLQKIADYNKKYAAAEPKPDDKEMDSLLAKDLADVRERATKRLGLTLDELELFSEQWDPVANLARGNPLLNQQQRHPMLVFGPAVPTLSAVGKDGFWRFASYEVMVICPTGYHLGLCRTNIDFLTGGIQREETQEYHYADVVAVSTNTTPDQGIETLDLREDKPIHFAKTLHRKFQVVVSSGDRSTIVVGIQDEQRPGEQAKLQPSGIDEVIHSVRRMLKEKKGGAAGPSGQIKGLSGGE
ncbi:MAG: hypothetical protein ACRDRO_20575 [Pseudonocardiaceae bacterium]